MKSSIISLSTLFAAATALVSASPSLSKLQERTSCSSSEFYYPQKSCCLPTGGIPNPPQCPAEKACPSSGWYWHPTHSCCVPKTSSTPPPSCGGSFNQWDDVDQCCKRPTPAPAPAPAPKPAPAPVTPAPSCPSTHFFYSPRACCLPNGGPPTTPSCPSDRGCPSEWWWHDTYNCCVPKNPNPPSTPSCSGAFSVWDQNDQCCKSPTTPPPQASGTIGRNNHKKRRGALESRLVSLCPADLQECPIKGTTEVECVDANEDLRNCGGCAALNLGKDCAAIPNVLGVTCLAAQKRCQVSSCEEGYRPSANGESCVLSLTSQRMSL